METLQTILIILLVTELLVIAACFAVITFFLLRTLRTLTDFINSLGRIRSFITIPALIAAIVSKFLKKRG